MGNVRDGNMKKNVNDVEVLISVENVIVTY